MIIVEDLRKSFGRTPVLKGIDFTAGSETVGLLGANGAGKTTFLKCLLGILDFEGKVEIGGIDVRKNAVAARRLIGYIPQSFPSWGDLSVRETFKFFSKLRRVDPARTEKIIEQFRLEEHSHKRIYQLSGGLRQKLSIGIALLSDPEIILLDEPTANLDAWAIKDILLILKDYMAQKTVILSSHRIEEVLAVSHRLVQIEDGRLKMPNVDELRLYSGG